MKSLFKPAAGRVVAKLSTSSRSRSGGSAPKRTLNRIAKMNTGRATRGRNASLRKFK